MPALATEPRLMPRDLDVLIALDHCPMTALQLLTFSKTFATPFTSERRVRERLQQLDAARRVRRWHYATAGQGAPNYYTLSRLGYRLLHGDDARPPAKRAFDPVAIARQHHTSCLADFIVHTAASAHRVGVPMTGFYRENTVAIHGGDDVVYPDCCFLLVPPGRSELRFFVELDNSTERLRSTTDADSWQRKLSIYEARADVMPDRRFRVLVVTTRSRGRLDHILRLAADSSRNAYRSLVYGVHLPSYLAEVDGVSAHCFTDHRGGAVSLLATRAVETASTASASPAIASTRAPTPPRSAPPVHATSHEHLVR